MKFKYNEKVVCINSFYVSMPNKSPVKKISKNKIYTINNPDGGNNDIELKEFKNVFYLEKRFISLKKYRKQKLKKINEIIKTKE